MPEHELTAREDDARGVTDPRATGEVGRRRDRRPGIGGWVVDRAEARPHLCATAVVLTTLNDRAAVGQHLRGEVQRRVAIRQRGDLLPGAGGIVTAAVRGEPVPGTRVVVVDEDAAVSLQKHRPRVETGGHTRHRRPAGAGRGRLDPGLRRRRQMNGQWLPIAPGRRGSRGRRNDHHGRYRHRRRDCGRSGRDVLAYEIARHL